MKGATIGMSELQWADPEETGEWAEEQPAASLECRLLGHHWKEATVDEDDPEMPYVRGGKGNRQRKRIILCWDHCKRCKMVKRKKTRHPFTGVVLERYNPQYLEGYLRKQAGHRRTRDPGNHLR
jgi:hypothetical protein